MDIRPRLGLWLRSLSIRRVALPTPLTIVRWSLSASIMALLILCVLQIWWESIEFSLQRRIHIDRQAYICKKPCIWCKGPQNG